MSGEHTLKAVRGSFIDVTRTVDNPEEIASALRFIEDGLLLIKQGKVEWFGEWEDGKHQIPDTIRVRDYRGKLIVPGFVDTHIHYPQSEMVGAYGEQLLEWLNKHTFPTERRYEDLEYAREMSAFFIKQLLRNGTTTALVFGTVHPQSVDALFEAASHINMRMIAGKVMMDRNAPDYLLDTAESSYHQSKELIERWHKNGRLLYAITPRFAPTSSPEQMAMAQRLKEEYPDADCTLDYDEAWKLLVSVRLAAQCTDARVNVVVEDLYAKFPDVNALADAPVEEIEEIVRPCGLGKSKARDISACMKILRDEYNGKVPDDFDKLLKLPGVGRKSANLIMGDVFGKPAIVTDTHCIRLTNRIGLVDGIKEPKKVEMALWKIIPPEEGSDLCHRLVYHGREICTARTKPYCDRCCLADVCKKVGV